MAFPPFHRGLAQQKLETTNPRRSATKLLQQGIFLILVREKEGPRSHFQKWGMYLKKWDLSFDPEKYIPSTFLVWVKLPHLPLHCWNDEYLIEIRNTLGKYIDNRNQKPQCFLAPGYMYK